MAFLPLFPLQLVAFPGETVNLHIFEPRYIQLITECMEREISFGIPVYLPDQRMEYGTSMKITALSKQYEGGRMDIQTQGQQVFQLSSLMNPVPQKLYMGGTVEFKDTETSTDILPGMIEQIKELYKYMQVAKEIDTESPNLSFRIGHKIGLSLSEEYQLLKRPVELDRQKFIQNHLLRILPVVRELEKTKERIRMNGHFKNFDPLTF